MVATAAPQAPGNAPAPAGGVVVVAPEQDPKFGVGQSAPIAAGKQAEAFLKERKLKAGYDQAQQLWVAIGTSSFGEKCGTPSFEPSRSKAFLKALGDAKEKLADFLGVRVQQEITRLLRQAPPGGFTPEAAVSAAAAQGLTAPPSLIEKTVTILNDEADRELKKRGLIDEQAKKDAEDARKAAAEAQKKRLELERDLIATDSFRQVIKTMAQAEISGLQSYRTFESSNPPEIAVVTAFNDNSARLSKALLGAGEAPVGVFSKPVDQWVEDLSEGELILTQGAQMRTDDKGEVVLVAFGTATPPRNQGLLNDIARKDARLHAVTAARMFVGSLIVNNVRATRAEDIKVYLNNGEATRNSDATEREMREVSETLTMNPEYIREFDTHHPCSPDGLPTYVCVVKISLSDARAANQLKSVLSAINGWKGGAGVTSMPSKPAPGRSGPGTPSGITGAGVEGELGPRRDSRGGAGARGLD